jgi:3',5'-cyclic AMP phosphodiesterase CpdA
VRVLHFSDIHLGLGIGHVPLADWPGKRLAGGLNLLLGRQRRFTKTAEKVEALATFARREGVELVVFSGDFTAMGTEAEFSAARALIDPFLEAPAGFVCVPGNHDLYATDVIREQRFERHFGDVLATGLPEARTDGPWPLVRLPEHGPAIVAVNSARPNPPPWRSSGAVPPAQLEGLADVLKRTEVQERFVLIVTHYAPRLHDGRPDHHHPYRVRIPDVGPEILCAGSATMEGRESFWLLDIEESGCRVSLGRWAGREYSVE